MANSDLFILEDEGNIFPVALLATHPNMQYNNPEEWSSQLHLCLKCKTSNVMELRFLTKASNVLIAWVTVISDILDSFYGNVIKHAFMLEVASDVDVLHIYFNG
jgi:hypothetical protein